jgi:hypothetical protein
MNYPNWTFDITQLPPTLFHAIEELEEERNTNGVASTPDETSDVIEQLFLTLGRLSMAELWHATTNGTLQINDRSVLSLLLDSRDASLQGHLTMGRWVGLSRNISKVMREHSVPTILKGLDSIDWGTFGDATNTVNRLIDFRNRFAHGSFSAPEEIINTHYHLLIEFIHQITGLYTQAIVAMEPTLGLQTPITWNNGKFSQTTNTPPVDDTNTVWLQSGSDWMSLSPFFVTTVTDGRYNFELSDFSKISVTGLFNASVLAQWQHKYSQEYQGNIDRGPIIQQREHTTPPDALQQVVTQGLQAHRGKTIQVIGYPGTGLDSVLPFVQSSTSTFEHVVLWDIQPGDLTQSANVLLNKLEHDLQPPPLTQKRPTLQDRTSNLESVFATQSVLLVVDGTAFGTAHYRYEPNTVLEVLNELVNCSLTILIVSHFSDQRNQVFYDEQIVWDQTEIISSNVLQNTIQRLCTSTLHKQIIDVLKTQTCTLFELCDKLDTITQTTVFEPEIEYALWHLRPLLKTTIKANDDQTQSDRVWTVFSSEVAP